MNRRQAVLITGGSRGLGKALAERFLAEGWDVAICATEGGPLEDTAAALRAGFPDQRVLAGVVDVSREDQMLGFADEVRSGLGAIDALVCNAGVHGPIGPLEDANWVGWVRAVEVNLFGTVLACRAVLPAMRAQGRGKIVALSGGGATQPRPGLSAYAASKSAIVRVVETLAVELAGSGIDVNAIAPGALNTRLLDQVLAAGPERVGADDYAKALAQRDSGGAGFAAAADVTLFLTSRASDGITGRLLAAQWDDWRALAGQRERLAAGDVYTLRRVTPEDRGW